MGFFNWLVNKKNNVSIVNKKNDVSIVNKKNDVSIVTIIDDITFYAIDMNSYYQRYSGVVRREFFHKNTWKAFSSRYANQDLYTYEKYRGFGGGGDYDINPWGYIIYKNGEPYMRTDVGYDSELFSKIPNIVENLNSKNIHLPIHVFSIYRNNSQLFNVSKYRFGSLSNSYIGEIDDLWDFSYKSVLIKLYKYLNEYKENVFGIQIVCNTNISDYLFFKTLKEFRDYIETEVKNKL